MYSVWHVNKHYKPELTNFAMDALSHVILKSSLNSARVVAYKFQKKSQNALTNAKNVRSLTVNIIAVTIKIQIFANFVNENYKILLLL